MGTRSVRRNSEDGCGRPGDVPRALGPVTGDTVPGPQTGQTPAWACIPDRIGTGSCSASGRGRVRAGRPHGHLRHHSRCQVAHWPPPLPLRVPSLEGSRGGEAPQRRQGLSSRTPLSRCAWKLLLLPFLLLSFSILLGSPVSRPSLHSLTLFLLLLFSSSFTWVTFCQGSLPPFCSPLADTAPSPVSSVRRRAEPVSLPDDKARVALMGGSRVPDAEPVEGPVACVPGPRPLPSQPAGDLGAQAETKPLSGPAAPPPRQVGRAAPAPQVGSASSWEDRSGCRSSSRDSHLCLSSSSIPSPGTGDVGGATGDREATAASPLGQQDSTACGPQTPLPPAGLSGDGVRTLVPSPHTRLSCPLPPPDLGFLQHLVPVFGC